MKLPAASLDAVLLIKVYHDHVLGGLRSPRIRGRRSMSAAVLDQLARALKPGGILLLMDHSAKAGHGRSDAGELHRIEDAFAIKDFGAHGFEVVATSELLRSRTMRAISLATRARCSAKQIDSCWCFASPEQMHQTTRRVQPAGDRGGIHGSGLARQLLSRARKTIIVGMLRMLKRAAGAGSSWVFSFAKRSLGSSWRAVAS